MRTADFRFDLPPELIAQEPAPRRDQSRLLVVHRQGGALEHRRFTDLPEYLQPGDVLILNDSRVIPARLHAINPATGGRFELLLLEEHAVNDWWAMLRPGRRAKRGARLQLVDRAGQPTAIHGTVLEVNSDGHRRLTWSGTANLAAELQTLGEIPLPPYIQRDRERPDDVQRYQTVYAGPAGSVAAPTAGLHFTPELLAAVQARGARVGRVTLHVGAGTFLPVKTDDLASHRMHAERFAIDAETVALVTAARAGGGRVFAVGTTATRALEACARRHAGSLAVDQGKTDIFLHPPATFHVVDCLLTNFHLPESTLLMLVSAFAAPGQAAAGRDLILAAYAEAIRQGYRFYSYGDAMLLL